MTYIETTTLQPDYKACKMTYISHLKDIRLVSIIPRLFIPIDQSLISSRSGNILRRVYPWQRPFESNIELYRSSFFVPWIDDLRLGLSICPYGLGTELWWNSWMSASSWVRGSTLFPRRAVLSV